MTSTAAVQLNNNVDRIYFIGIDRCKNGLTTSARFQRGLVQTFGKLEENGDIVNTRTRGEIQEILGISPATASRNNTRHINAGAMEKRGVNTYVYHNDASDGEEIKFWYCPTEMFTESYPGEDDDGNPVVVKFTYDDCLVYAYFYTLLPHTGENKRTIKATFDEIADALGIDPSTVSEAVTKLRWARFLRFPRGWVGKNRYKKSRIGLGRGFSWFKKEQEFRAILKAKKKEQKAADAQQETPQKTPVRRSVEREVYYGKLQTDATKKADKALAEALKNNDFRRLNKELADTRFQYNAAIIRGDAGKQRELSSKIKGLENKRTTVLENIGIAPEQLEPEYYVKCKECKDTGTKANGTACDCWKKKRGSPPRDGKEKVVGEQN